MNSTDIKLLYKQLKNELETNDNENVCCICKLKITKYNSITLKCSHKYHINCLFKNKKPYSILCPYCNFNNKLDKIKCKDCKCYNHTLNDSGYCKIHINRVLSKINKLNKVLDNLEKKEDILSEKINELNILKETNIQNNHICGCIMINGKQCNRNVKDNLIYCKIHQKKLNNDLVKLELNSNKLKNEQDIIKKKIESVKKLIY